MYDRGRRWKKICIYEYVKKIIREYSSPKRGFQHLRMKNVEKNRRGSRATYEAFNKRIEE